jgi:hypothetical protein
MAFDREDGREGKSSEAEARDEALLKLLERDTAAVLCALDGR